MSVREFVRGRRVDRGKEKDRPLERGRTGLGKSKRERCQLFVIVKITGDSQKQSVMDIVRELSPWNCLEISTNRRHHTLLAFS